MTSVHRSDLPAFVPGHSTIDPADLRRLVRELAPQTVDRYRWLHRHPELSFEERETSRFIADMLRTIDGVEEVSSPTPTSVVAAIQGTAPGDRETGNVGPARVIALRADIDALAVQEETGLEYASEVPGVMHACGHDGHVAILLSVASVLSGLRSRFRGEVRLLFQHAEEQPPGGARGLVAAGVLRGADAVVGLHLIAQLPTGSLALSSGPLMACSNTFSIRVTGAGGHGAYPHETVDPVAIGAQIVTNLQHIASRTVDPIASAVVSVTRFVADNQPNVIPSTVELGGTTRAFDADVRADVLRRLEQIATGVATAHGAIAEVTIEEGYPVLVNDGPLTEVVRAVLAAGLPDVALVEQHQEMGVDDFAVLASQVPGCFFNVGAGDPTWESSAPHHHPSFHIDERALPIGVEALTVVALGLL